jgi:hypothetical protein
MSSNIRKTTGAIPIALAAVILLGLVPEASAAERPRVVVLTDISNEPDDEESLVRFLVYSNEFEVEGLIATTSTHLRTKTREDLIRRQIEAYGQVRANLEKHAPGYPTPEQLLAVTHTGQPGYGMEAVGTGKAAAGSRRIIEVVDHPDERPVWISVWGGANTLAQALWDVRETRSPEDLARFVAKLRVYTISDQDDAGRWLRLEFPGLFYIVSPSNQGWKEYWQATWTGISGDRHYANGPFHAFDLVDNPWLERNVISDHGPLGALYPKLAYIMEGDTPSFLGLVDNGLGWHVSPAYGGWGGRYVLFQSYAETRPIWTNSMDSRDTVTADDGYTYTSDMATIWRWREHFQHDFAARMDWCVAPEYDQANHNPVAVLNGDTTKDVLEIEARPGETVSFSAEGSRDPDGDIFTTSWFVYPEAGTHRGMVLLSDSGGPQTRMVAPDVEKPETVHVIMQLEDQGRPHLFAYRRAVVTVRP